MGSESEAATGKDNNLLFSINGERFELSSVDPSTTLLEFLRSRTRFKGTKLGCGEGIVFRSLCLHLFFFSRCSYSRSVNRFVSLSMNPICCVCVLEFQ